MKRLASSLLACLLVTISLTARAGVYWQAGVRSTTVSVCFVGNATTSRPERVQQVLSYIARFSYAANIDFDYLGSCPAPTRQVDGTDFHDGDIRVVIPGTSVSGEGLVPGQGCGMFRNPDGSYTGGNDGWGSWSNSPNDLALNRACVYNLKLGDDAGADSIPYLDHTLHEFGHALGLAHEHDRIDGDTVACPALNPWLTSGLMTMYDPRSVMHYQYLACGINGNYGHVGLSALDQLSLHILYPEDNRVAEFVGTTVLRANTLLRLQPAWQVRGANLSFVAAAFVWQLDGVVVGSSGQLELDPGRPGVYALTLTHQDFLGRSYRYSGVVRVLEASEYTQTIVAPSAALAALWTSF